MNFSDYSLFGVSAALQSAISCGLLDELWRGPGTSAELASRANCDSSATERVLEVLLATGTLARTGDRYALSERLSEAVGRGPGGWPGFRALWAHTPEFLRSGTRLRSMDGSGAQRSEEYSGTVSGLGELFSGAAALLSKRLPARRQILDVGAGSGVWSLAMLVEALDARLTALDFEAVLPNFRARAERLGLLERVQVFPANFHDFTIDQRFDRVVLANVLHLESEAGADALVARSARLVIPEGDIVVIDVLDELGRDVAYAAYGLHLAMRTQGGRAHPGSFLRASLKRAGFQNVERIDLSSEVEGLGALLATR
ncbi:MAG TPA: class I SAM-dependent methyltransferase [Polyangiaceae bacterium]|jgi:ubiquinone/menaquinone biosynthesis C-methylase UbiE|nr:class I SAM-dependent methyltransferase [Polyangiaceae bacterium]